MFLSGSIFAMAVVFMPLAGASVHKWGPRRIWRISMLGMSAGFFLMGQMSGIAGAAAAGIIIGVFFAGISSTLDLVQSKLMDEDSAQSGRHREGFVFSVLVFFRKLSGLAASAVYTLIFLFTGFESGNNPGAMPQTAAKIMLAFAPALFCAIAFIISGFVKFQSEAVREN